jgi:23S rRNA pseudouridine2605 synthase
MRLQTFLARAGAAPSRRKAEALIEAGRVSVNGRTASLGANASPADRVLLDDRPVQLPATFAYLALNKPAGYLTTMHDEPGRSRPTVSALMPPVPGLVPVGRLDAATTGLLLLTNDGSLAHRIAHPSSRLDKEYALTVQNPVPPAALHALAAGPTLEDGRMASPRISSLRKSPTHTTFHLTIHEGRNRIIRRACTAVNLNLRSLHRVRIGPILLGDLPEGSYRELTESEVESLKAHDR